MKSKILPYITVYNDYEALTKLLVAIQAQTYQIDQIFICDNSPENIIKSEDNLVVKHNPENIGIGAGIKEALELAIEENYDFLWTFDQDSVPTPKCLEILLNNFNKLNQEDYQIGIIASTPIDINNKNQIIQGAVFKKDIFIGYTPENQDLPYECDAPITSGSLISLKVAKSIDFPRSDLFIDGIDLDYGYRLKQNGFHNIIVPDAIMYHNFGSPKIVKFFNKELTFQQYSALRYYYICRNHTYLETRFSQSYYKLTSSLKRIKYLIYTTVKIMLYEDTEKLIKIWACLLGTVHGFCGKLGKLWG
jgi:rhamnosyltransferase